ncbi:MAG: RnfABCDGE type electron transport complex subunit B [Candidatus Krumholzibacteriia bacterium]
MLVATGVLAGLGLLSGLGLGLAARVFAVERDPRQERIADLLPGANCGGCGLAGCADFAGAVVAGKAAVDGCPVGGAETARAVAALMGEALVERERRVALIHCQGGDDIAVRKYRYNGVASCAAAAALAAGPKRCEQGCVGLADCQDACGFQAIEILPTGIARVIPERCTACGRCVDACPQGLIELVPASARVHVLCASTARGGEARKACSAACIGCKKCEKAAPESFAVTDFLARLDYAGPPVDVDVVSLCGTGALRILDLDTPARRH